MSAHVLRIEFDGGIFPRITVVCNEPPEALCRAEFDCTCEEYADTGIGADGIPWHTLTDGYMDDDQREAAEQGNPPRHYGQHGGECPYALWLNEDDPSESGRGTADVPIASFQWVGDGYEWSIGGAQ